MPEFSTYVDVDVYEFISECSKREIKELIECLVENGHINESSIITETSKNPTLISLSPKYNNDKEKEPKEYFIKQLYLTKGYE